MDTERLQLPLQIERIPEEHAIEIFAANCTDQPFDERMRNRRIGHRLDLVDFDDTQVGEPAMKAKQRVVVGADVFRGKGWPATA